MSTDVEKERGLRDKLSAVLPHLAEGTIIKGFGRGSSELGFPTANFTEDVIDNLPPDLVGGIYWGFANVDRGPVYGMVMSIGWNPFYNNEKKAMETHILNTYNADLYGKHLKTMMVGFLRPEQNFESLQDLKAAISNDILNAETLMKSEEYLALKTDDFFNKA